MQEIKLASLKAAKVDDVDTELEKAQVVMHEARKKVITQVTKLFYLFSMQKS